MPNAPVIDISYPSPQSTIKHVISSSVLNVCPATFSVQHHLISFLKFPMFIFLSHPSVSPFLLQINVISVFQCVKALQLHKIQISWLPSSHKTEPDIDGDRVLIPITEKFLQKELIILKTY